MWFNMRHLAALLLCLERATARNSTWIYQPPRHVVQRRSLRLWDTRHMHAHEVFYPSSFSSTVKVWYRRKMLKTTFVLLRLSIIGEDWENDLREQMLRCYIFDAHLQELWVLYTELIRHEWGLDRE